MSEDARHEVGIPNIAERKDRELRVNYGLHGGCDRYSMVKMYPWLSEWRRGSETVKEQRWN